MEWLSKSINKAVSEGELKAYATKRGAEKINHLLFADDILIFARDCPQNVEKLMGILDKFCKISGQVLNNNKSQIFFSKWISHDKKDQILNMTKFVDSNLPTKYLGAPLMQGRVRMSYFDSLLDNLHCKIKGWMRNLLSMGGRVALIQSVLSSMSFHVMAVLPIPKGVLRKMESLVANFLWDHGPTKKFHWVRYELLCRPKNKGGLGFRRLVDNMLAFHGKLAWDYLKQQSLWSRYAKSRFIVGKLGSPIWNAISHIIIYLRDQSLWEIGDGSLKIDNICWHFDIPCRSDMRGLSVKDILERPTQRFSFLGSLPRFAADFYKDVRYGNYPIKLIWTGHPSGCFSIKEFLETYSTNHPNIPWAAAIWQQWIPPKVSLFMWRFMMRGLPLDANVRRIGIPLTSRCLCCRQHEETLNHLFFQGVWAKEVWNLLAGAFGCSKPSSIRTFNNSWIIPSRNNNYLQSLKIGLACYGLWEIWKARNNVLHEGPKPCFPAVLSHWARCIIYLIPGDMSNSRDIRKALNFFDIHYLYKPRITGKWRCWDPGVEGVCLDIFISETGKKAVGAGLFRTQSGNFKLALNLQVTGFCSSANLFVYIKHALDVARRHNICVSIIQSSHSEMICAGRGSANSGAPHISSFINYVFDQYGVSKMRRISTMLNHAAVCLAYNCHLFMEETIASKLPKAVQRSILQDKMRLGSFCSRHLDNLQEEIGHYSIRDDNTSSGSSSVALVNFRDDSLV